jgi:peptidoglycan-associated lipoprotein
MKLVSARRYFCYFLFTIMISVFGCGVKYQIKDGKTAFDLKRYGQAIELFKKQIETEERKEGKAFLHYHLAMSYDKLNMYPDAIEHYNLSVQNGQGNEAILKKAYSLKKSMQYKQAAAVFESLLKVSELTQEVNQQKNLCSRLHDELSKMPKNVQIESFLPTELGSNYSAVNYDDNFIVFTADGNDVEQKDIYAWTNRKYSDIFIADKTAGSISKFDNMINSQYNDGTPAFNTNNTMMVFTRCFNTEGNGDDYCKLMLSRRFNGLWEKPRPLDFTENNVNYSQPCFFENDSILIFSAKPKGNDQYDLFYAEWDGNTYVEPYPMPKAINTSYNEHFPTKDKDTLYFSSDRISGYGGLDIYKTYIKPDGEWAIAKQLSYPYNSGADDFGLNIDRTSPRPSNVGETGFISSSRGNNGLDIIYKYKILTDAVIPKKDTIKIIPNVVEENIEVYLALKVLDASNRKPIVSSDVTIEFSNKSVIKGKTDRNGLLLTAIPSGLDILAKVNKYEYLNGSISFNSKGLKSNPATINKEVLLSKIEIGKEIILNDIYYDYDKWDLKPEAMPSLTYLMRLLEDNPDLRIELGSHTDCRGENDYNQVLSEKRAKSVIDFLLNRGVAFNRLVAKGYGEAIPSVICDCAVCTEEEHQINRRTSFKIL